MGKTTMKRAMSLSAQRARPLVQRAFSTASTGSADHTKKKTTQLRELFYKKELDYIMEAHNGLSAKIVEEAGFKAIWASGLSLSAQLGVRDNNEASWTQVVEVVDFMSECTDIPILLDGDTGFGNFNNARRLIGKLERSDIGGVCFEDKLFPKTNSFIDGEQQPLADIEEFCGKIMACKDTQKDPDFMIVARLEAFITGYGLEEAYKRADAYHRAGADAILCHSKKKDDSDIREFMEAWGDRLPVVIVPTKYPDVHCDTFRDYGVGAVIWANHNMRASVAAMQKVTKDIYENQTLKNVEYSGDLQTVAEVFRLQRTGELKEAENKYGNPVEIAKRMAPGPNPMANA